MTVHHLLEAELEILDAAVFYKERAGDLAADFYNEFKRGREEIASFPEFWGPVGGGYRRKLLDRYPYGIICRVEGDEILIVALAHTSRPPGILERTLKSLLLRPPEPLRIALGNGRLRSRNLR